MLKILYAISNNRNSAIQLHRFLEAMRGLPHLIKVAAYKNSYPPNLNIDWTLDCLQNMFRPDHISLDNDNFTTYFEQIKYYNPDLIISDMEYYSSEIASNLGITLWQCSSSLLNYAITNEYKYNLGVFKKYAFLMSRIPIHVQRMINMQDNSNCNYICSHFGDHTNPPPIKNNYEWIRPYFQLGKYSVPCQHNIVGAMLGSDKNLIKQLKKYPDTICFTDYDTEYYGNPIIKNLYNQKEYYCNVANCKLFMCNGQSSFLADAFYNGKYTITMGAQDLESITNIAVSEKLRLSSPILLENDSCNYESVIPILSNGHQFLHEKIMEL